MHPLRRALLVLVVLPVLVLPAACRGGSSADPPGTAGGPDATDSRSLPPATTAPVGPASGPLGLKWSWFQPNTLDFVRRSSGGWTFHEVEWCEIETSPGQRDWGELDEVVARAGELGHEPMLKLRTGQCWGTLPPVEGSVDPAEVAAKTPSTPPVEISAYLDFVTALVQRYAALGVHEYAVENEIDVANFWAATTADYESLVRQVAPAIRAADPQARVLDAGVSSTSYGVVLAAADLAAGDEAAALAGYQLYYGRRLEGGVSRFPAVTSASDLRTVLAGAAARRSIESFDAEVRLAREGVVDVYQLHFYEDVRTLPAVLSLLDAELAGATPVEAWEVGVAWPGEGFDERAHADEVFRLVGLLLAADVRPVVYLPVAFTPGDRTQVFRGLVHEDGTLLSAGLGWVALADALADLGDASVTPLTGRLTGASWEVDGREAAVVWSDAGPATLPAGGVARVVDATGAEVDPTAPVGAEPVLVLGSAGDSLAVGLVDPP